MNEALLFFLQYILPPTVSTGVIGLIVSHFYNKKIESFKNELDTKLYEHQILFSKLHEKRGVIVENLYNKLIDATGEVRNYFQPVRFAEVNMEELQKNTEDKLNNYIDYFKHNDIYFDKEVCKHLEKTIELIYELFGHNEVKIMLIEDIKANPDMTSEERLELNKRKGKIRELTDKILPANVELIGTEFRKIIGVNK